MNIIMHSEEEENIYKTKYIDIMHFVDGILEDIHNTIKENQAITESISTAIDLLTEIKHIGDIND